MQTTCALGAVELLRDADSHIDLRAIATLQPSYVPRLPKRKGSMRRLTSTVAIALAILSLFPNPSRADDWLTYVRLRGDYYFLDDQAPSEISCRVSISTLDPAYLRAQLQPVQDKIDVDQNLNSFRVTYSKGVGITISEPHFTVRLKEAVDLPDRATVQGGLDLINRGAAMQISGARQIIERIFMEIIRPKREEISAVKVTASEGTAKIEYTRDGLHVTQIYLAGARKTFVKAAGISTPIESSDEFTVIGGKRALSKSSAMITQGDMTTTVETAVLYQQVGGVSFPSLLNHRSHLENSTMKQDVKQTISLDQCVNK